MSRQRRWNGFIARPLHQFDFVLGQPCHWKHEQLLSSGALAPFRREAGKKQADWQKKFYKK